MRLGWSSFLLLPVLGCRSTAEPAPRAPAPSPSAPAPACLGLGPGVSCEGLEAPMSTSALNVRGEPLEVCSTDPMTGWTREGLCTTGPGDGGVHVVCAEMTA